MDIGSLQRNACCGCCVSTSVMAETPENEKTSVVFKKPLTFMYVDFVYWHLILVTPDGHTFVCAVLPDLSA